jgi:hypothetical protein
MKFCVFEMYIFNFSSNFDGFFIEWIVFSVFGSMSANFLYLLQLLR